MTNRSSSGFSDELRISPRPVIAIVGISALAIACLGNGRAEPLDWAAASLFSLLVFGLAVVAWAPDEWRRR